MAQQIIAAEGGHIIPFFVNEFTIVNSAVANFSTRSPAHAALHISNGTKSPRASNRCEAKSEISAFLFITDP